MRTRQNPVRVGGVGPALSQRLIVELEPGEPISGWVEGEGVPRRRFDGLLELIALLESARALTDPPAAAEQAG
jgi:hypothetical protein